VGENDTTRFDSDETGHRLQACALTVEPRQDRAIVYLPTSGEGALVRYVTVTRWPSPLR
jgi:hypothetical protein